MEAKDALTSLIEVLERDPDPRVRQVAAWAIGQIDS
jgi:HEAT repeat protein